MAEYDSDIEALEAGAQDLGQAFGQAAGLAAGFDAEMRRIHQTFSVTHQGAAQLEKTLSRGVKNAIYDLVLGGATLSEAFHNIGQSLINSAYNAAVKPVAGHVGGMLSDVVKNLFGEFSPFADGAGFAQGRVMPFANGGVVSGPVTFPMRGGTGLMGEAGPEAIMPLTRGADGKLGVRAQGGGAAPVTVVMNITTPDAQGFRRSQSQIAAEMSRALGRGRRNR